MSCCLHAYNQCLTACVTLSFFLSFSTHTQQQVALDFHKLRERAPFLFVSPALNKVYYALMGLKDFFWRCVPREMGSWLLLLLLLLLWWWWWWWWW